MSLSYPPVPYAPMSTSIASPHVVRLLIPMPIPRTPNATYFDERGVRAFLTLILQHGSCAGITNADELVSFIVRYSSDRVRAVIQYIPELDEDTPNRTWSAAEQQMLLLYGSSDEPRCVSEQELLEFCREQSAKPPFRSKFEVEQYLRNFQYIAAPLLKQQDITIAQRDYYFVSGIPSAIKNWFILRVPESQRTRSNPIPLADTLGILYEYFDPDALFPGLWDELGDFSEPAESLVPSTEHRMSPLQSIPLTSAPFHSTIQLSMPLTLPAPPQATVSLPSPPEIKAFPHSSPASSTSSLLEFEPPSKLEPKHVHWDFDNAADFDQDSAEEQFKASPSDDEPLEDIIESGERESDFVGYQYKGSAVDSCEEYSITDRVSGFRWALNQLKHLAACQDVDQASVADITRGIQAELEQCLTSASCGYVGLQISSNSSYSYNNSGSFSETVADVLEPIDPPTTPKEVDDDYERYLAGEYDNIEPSFSDTSKVSDSGDITESDSSRIFESATEFEDESLMGNFSSPSDVQVPEFIESSDYMQSITVFDPMPHALSYLLSYEDFDAVFRPDGVSLEHVNVQHLEAPEFDLESILELYTSVEPSQLSIPPPITCFDPCSESDSVTDLFIELFYSEKNAHYPSAPFPNNEPDPVTIYESVDIPELSCLVHSATHSELESTTDLILELFYAEPNSSELSAAVINHEQDAQADFESYFTQDAAELSSISHSTQLSSHPEPESTTHLFIELFYTDRNFPEPSNTSSDNERNLDLIYELYFDADIPELSSHLPFIRSISDSEPISITDTYIELILSKEISRGVDSETIASAGERDSSTHTHTILTKICAPFLNFTPMSAQSRFWVLR
ncbi:hypothetical protein B0H14DRAFT_3757972 [Mycena olivaceomarginata]|nr:hypothetical protein B0H14DRAFT_3757972 [Mycena olivaceomarginata]